ncbi:helix-turn-helix domain-containing protein, partial [Pseudomonas aeruginosa]
VNQLFSQSRGSAGSRSILGMLREEGVTIGRFRVRRLMRELGLVSKRWIQPVVATPLIVEVFMGRPAGWMQELTGRGAMRSPGAPSLRREIERLFWEQIATGITSERAAEAISVSSAVGTRWFRHRGGMPLFMSNHISGRYLSFAEREEIGLLRAQSVGVREIARRLGRSPSTISRELTRNAATRSGQLEYRASVAQW